MHTTSSLKTQITQFLSGPHILILFSLLIMGSALFFTLSRGGMLSFMAGLIIMSIVALTKKELNSKIWFNIAIFGAITLTILWLGATPVIEKILSIKAEIMSKYFGGRLPIWQGTLQYVKDYFIFGSGLGTFNYVFPQYKPAEIIAKHYTYAHSDFFELLAETGILGFSLIIIALLSFIIYLFRSFKKQNNQIAINLFLGLFGALASIIIHSLTDFNMKIPSNALMVMIVAVLSFLIVHYIKDHSFSFNYYTFPIKPAIKKYIYAGFIPIGLIACFWIVKPALADYFYKKEIKEADLPLPEWERIEVRVKALKRSIFLDPANALYHYELAKLYSKGSSMYDVRSAMYEYKRAVALNPTNSKYHQSLAWLYGQLDRVPSFAKASEDKQEKDKSYEELAREHFEKAICLEPNNPYRYRAYALWLIQNPTQENIAQSMEIYRKAIALNPDLTEEAIAQYFAFDKNYEKIIPILPGSKESDLKFYRYIEQNINLRTAIECAEKYLKTYPENADINFWIANSSFYDKSFNWDFTEHHYEIAFKLDPHNGHYRLWYGINLYYKKEHITALQNIEKAETLGLNSYEKELGESFIKKCKELI